MKLPADLEIEVREVQAHMQEELLAVRWCLPSRSIKKQPSASRRTLLSPLLWPSDEKLNHDRNMRSWCLVVWSGTRHIAHSQGSEVMLGPGGQPGACR